MDVTYVNFSLVDRDNKNVQKAEKDPRKKKDEKCKLTEHSYFNVYKKANKYKQKNMQVHQQINAIRQELEENSDSLSEVERKGMQIEISNLLSKSKKYKVNAKKEYRKALKVQEFMKNNMLSKFLDSIMVKNHIDVSSIDSESIKTSVEETLSSNNESQNFESVMLDDVSNNSDIELNQNNNLGQGMDLEDIQPDFISMPHKEIGHNSSDYNQYFTEINDNIFSENKGLENQQIQAESSERKGVNLESININSSSEEYALRVGEQMQKLERKRQQLIAKFDEFAMQEATSEKGLAEEQEKTQQMFGIVNGIMQGIEAETVEIGQKVEASQENISRLNARIQEEVATQRALNEMINAYSTSAGKISGNVKGR